jgi:cyanophycin synthetase
VEDIAGYFNVKCLGIDVLTADISKPWTEGNFGIIEINAGPGVFMHLAPAYGGSVDVPKFIMQSHFPKQGSGRIPIIATNKTSKYFIEQLLLRLKEIKPNVFFASLINEGVFFNERFFYNNHEHDQNVKIILRNPKTEMALFTHSLDNIYDYGLFHRGADVVILNNAEYVEEITLKDQLIKGGLFIKINKNTIEIIANDLLKQEINIDNPQEIDDRLIDIIQPFLSDLFNKYE